MVLGLEYLLALMVGGYSPAPLEEIAVAPAVNYFGHFEQNLEHSVAPDWSAGLGRWADNHRSHRRLGSKPTVLSRQRLPVTRRSGFLNWSEYGANRGLGWVERTWSLFAAGEGRMAQDYY